MWAKVKKIWSVTATVWCVGLLVASGLMSYDIHLKREQLKVAAKEVTELNKTYKSLVKKKYKCYEFKI